MSRIDAISSETVAQRSISIMHEAPDRIAMTTSRFSPTCPLALDPDSGTVRAVAGRRRRLVANDEIGG